jgi:hypothetical protein
MDTSVCGQLCHELLFEIEGKWIPQIRGLGKLLGLDLNNSHTRLHAAVTCELPEKD